MNDQSNPKFENVMVIDDNVVDLYIASRMISKNNFGKNVLMYSKAEEALKFLIANEFNNSALPEIIFIDIYMPIMSGFEFLAEYNKLSDSLKDYCKIYIVSSTIDDSDILNAKTNVNIVSFEVKPLTKEFLDKI
jgi:CheY-like chemotaxis protein